MSIEERVVRWARRACAMLNAVRTVMVALRRLLIAVFLITTTVLIWTNEVLPVLK
jgi:hypothetical protein